jgi:putative nucleotidyltransferase with HDIG domain
MGKHILVVDDDELFRSALEATLQGEGYQVSLAGNGKVAESMIMSGTYDAVISDIRMPEMTGIELLHFAKKSKPDLPVILMTGFAELEETTEAIELGAKQFLSKPFRKDELLIIVRKATKEETATTNEPSDTDFCKLSLDSFISGKEIQYDIYVRLSETKFVKVAHRGEDLPVDRIQSYKSKNIRYLYLLKSDFRLFVDFKAPAGAGGMEKAKKTQLMKRTSDLLQSLYVSEIDQDSFDSAKTLIENTVAVLTDSDELSKLLMTLSDHSEHLYVHSLGVGLYSLIIAREMGWNAAATHFKIAMGALLHDIGDTEISRTILDKTGTELSPEEIKTVESHAALGVAILKKAPSVPSEVLEIASQHHESSLGMGYPAGLKLKDIHPLARLVAVANEFSKLVIKSAHSKGIRPADAIRRIESLYADSFDPQFVLPLMKVFKLEPTSEFKAFAEKKA